MAEQDLINDLISDKALKQVETLSNTLVSAQGDLLKMVKGFNDLNKALGGAKSLKDYTKAQAEVPKATEAIIKSQEKARLADIKLAQAREKNIDAYNKKIAQQEAQTKKATEAQLKANDAFNIMTASLKKAENEAKTLGATFGASSPEFKEATKKVNELRDAVDKIEQPLGLFQRNVGNYKSGFNGLSNSFSQLAREAPAFAVNASTGFLALSNNLPVFFDELQRLSEQVKQNKIDILEQAEAIGLQARSSAIATGATEAEAVAQGNLARQTEIANLALTEQSVARGLLKSIFSLNTLLSVAVTLLTIYGAKIVEFVETLFQGKEAIDTFAKNQKALNDVFKESSKDAGSQITSLKILYKATQDNTLSSKERTDAAKELKKEYPEAFKNATILSILNGKEAGSFDLATKAILENARAKAKKGKLEAIETERLEADIQQKKIQIAQTNELKRLNAIPDSKINTGGRVGTVESAKKIRDVLREDGRKKINDRAKEALEEVRLTKESLDKREKFLNDFTDNRNLLNATLTKDTGKNKKPGKDKNFFSSDLELEKVRRERLAEINSAILSDEKINSDDRILALEAFLQDKERVIEIEKQIAEAKTKFDYNNLVKNGDLTLDAQRKYDNDLILIDEKAINDRAKLDEEGADKALKIFQDQLSERTKARIQANTNELNVLNTQRDNVLLKLNEEFKAGKITREQYEKDKLDIIKIYNKLYFEAQLRQLEAELALANLNGNEQKRIAAEIAALKIKYSNDATEVDLANTEKKKAAERQLRDLQFQFAGEVLGLSQTISDAIFTKEAERLDIADAKATEQSDFEKQRVEESILSAEDKAVRMAQIDSKDEARKKILADKQRALQIKQAKLNKVFALADIALNTSKAVMAIASTGGGTYYADFGISAATLTAFALATGAIQAATVLATPIPQFEDGGKMQKDGMAIYSEAGRELQINPNGTMQLTPDKPTLGYVKGGTEFISNKDLMNMLLTPEKKQYSGGQEISMDLVIKAINNGASDTQKAIKSIPVNSFNITKQGWFNTQTKNNGRTQYLSRNLD